MAMIDVESDHIHTFVSGSVERRMLMIKEPSDAILKLLKAGNFDCVNLFGDVQSYEFLVPYAKDIRWLYCCNPASEDGLEKLQGIERLSFLNDPPPDFEFLRLKKLRYFETHHGGDLDMEQLNHPKLEFLNIRGNGLKDFTVLKDAKSLRGIFLSYCGIINLSGLERFSKIRELRITNAKRLTDVSTLCATKHLEMFQLQKTPKLTEIFPSLALKKLRLAIIEPGKADAQANADVLSEMPDLEEAAIDVPLRKVNLKAVADHPRLSYICLKAISKSKAPTTKAVTSEMERHGRIVSNVRVFAGDRVEFNMKPLKRKRVTAKFYGWRNRNSLHFGNEVPNKK